MNDVIVELLDGLLSCGECGVPMLSDGEGNYCHIQDICRERLIQLMVDPFVAGRVFDWLCGLKLSCPCGGEKPNPFSKIPHGEAIAYLGTRRGATDFHRTIHDLFAETGDHARRSNSNHRR